MEKKDMEKLAKDYVEANDAYEKLMGRFVVSGAVVEGKKMGMPERMLTPIGMEELDEAWAKVEAAHKAWRQGVLEYGVERRE